MSTNEKYLLTVTKPFCAQYDDELSVETGQIIQYIRKIDRFWFEVYFDGIIKKVPVNNCLEIEANLIQNLKIAEKSDQKIFVSKHDFCDNCEEGDLKFSRSEIIIGFYAVNNDWWQGTRLNSVKYENDTFIISKLDCGIFPLSYVWQLREDLLPSNFYHHKGITVLSKDEEIKDSDEDSVVKLEVSGTKTSLDEFLFYVKVNTKMTPQLEKEIELPEIGEVFGIINVPDKMFFYGQSLTRNVQGLFPQNFVSRIEANDLEKYLNFVNDNESYQKQINKKDCIDFTPTQSPSLHSQEALKNHSEIKPSQSLEFDEKRQFNCDAPPPSYESAMQSKMSYGYTNNMFNEVEPYGKVLYNFEAQDSSELSLKQNEIVHLIRYVDQDWMEGKINGQIGFFPKSYISVIVDCERNQPENSNFTNIQEIHPSTNQPQISVIDLPPDTNARILFDFDGEMEQDLKVQTGDHVTLLRKFTTTDWVEARDSSGNIGFVHLNLCQLLTHDTSQNNDDSFKKIHASENNFFSSNEIFDTDPSHENERNLCSSIIESKPHRPAPPAPRGTISTLPTFNQFLIQEKQEQFDVNSHSNTPAELSDQSSKVYKQNQRECVITELIQTEKDYCNALSTCVHVFEKNFSEAAKFNVDLAKFINNMKGIIEVSKHFLKLIDNYAYNRPFVDQRVGICFLDLKFLLNEKYIQFCREHDQLQAQLRLYEVDLKSKTFINKCLVEIQKEANCFNLSSMLIKPVQRILKYPLLLNELIKWTEETHVDYEPLKMAFKLMTDIATCINEHKRREDLIIKYCKANDSTFSERLKNLNMHTVKKKSSRLGYRILSTLTFSSGHKDKDYEVALNKFHSLEKSIRSFVKNLKEYLDNLDKYFAQSMTIVESIGDYYDTQRNPRDEISQLRNAHIKIYKDCFKPFKNSIDKNAIAPLNYLLSKFQTSFKLIGKRDDKRIDYEASLRSKNDSSLAKSMFEALNQQLIDELPILTETSKEIFSNCLEVFFNKLIKLTCLIAKVQLDLHQLPLVQNTSFEFFSDIEEMFRVRHIGVLEEIIADFSLLHASSFNDLKSSSSTLTRLTRNKNMNTWKNSLPVNKVTVHHQDSSKIQQSQEEFHRRDLITKYTAENLYLVTKNYEPCDLLEIHAKENDLVGVIKYKEPNGLENRWFVDRGNGNLGFLPRSLLIQYQNSFFVGNDSYCSEKMIEKQTLPNQYNYSSLISIEEIQPATIETNISLLELSEFDPLSTDIKEKSITSTGSKTLENSTIKQISDSISNNDNYLAAYNFNPNGPNQVSLHIDERVTVINKQDIGGNFEWWLVVNSSNQKGYVPANYLKKIL